MAEPLFSSPWATRSTGITPQPISRAIVFHPIIHARPLAKK
jgi:hypothetical protein